VEETKEISETDRDAIVSALFSGLPLTAAQQQLLSSLSQTLLQDINARLFRLRANAGTGTGGAQGPTGGKEVKAPVEEVFHKWEIYGAGDYGYFDLDGTGRNAGFQSDTWVATLGAEYKINRNFTVGIAGSYVNSAADMSAKIGSIDTEGGAGAVYGSAVFGAFYADLLYSLGAYDQDIRRNTFTGRTARGDTDVITNAIQFNTGYNFVTGNLRTGPIAGLSWLHGDIDGYRETGGGNAGLNVAGQNFDSLISQLGWQASYAAQTGFGAIIPQIRASWDHEYLNSAQNVSANLQQSPFSNGNSFTATGKSSTAGRDWLNLGVGVSAQFGERCTVTLDYTAHLFQDRTNAQTGSVKVGISF
jgi:outer membrane lipase/esterase